MAPRLKYLCLESHLNGRYFKAGVVYLFAVAPAGDYAAMFSLFNGDEMSPAPNYGVIDLDGSWYPLDGAIGWDDMRFAASRDRQGVAQKPDFDFDELGLLMPQNDPTEIIYINDQFPHAMKTGGIIHPHIHWIQTADGQVPIFKMDIRIYKNDGAVPGPFTTYAVVGDPEFEYDDSGGMAQISVFAPIDLAALGIDTTSGLFDVKLYRDDNVVVGDVLLKTFDIHIPIDAPLGSGQEFIK